MRRTWNLTGLYDHQRDRPPADRGGRRRRKGIATSTDVTCANCAHWVDTRDGALCRFCQKPIAGGAS